MSMTTDFILRITIAAVLGGINGLEREYRSKEAGFRTHFLVALGSALFMVISAYGFEGALISTEHRLDVSRIAAQVVTGIGFIGAGTIIFQKHVVKGLTTAAGLWVTAAIGLTCGGGMYLLAISSTVLVLISLEAFNWILHRFGKRIINVVFTSPTQEDIRKILDNLRNDGMELDSYSMKETHIASGVVYRVNMDIKIKRDKYEMRIIDLMDQFDGVSIENIEN
ncbi:MAG: MgtC/SapB family protein [Prevotella sp.]|nr:MgtC/SapB family protein [Prevotella sp.]